MLSLCSDVQFRVSHIPTGVTERKIQRILDARLPQAFIELWALKGKKKIQGRMSVPQDVVAKCDELQEVLKRESGCMMFIGPIKVHLRKDAKRNHEHSVRNRMKTFEKEQKSLRLMLERVSNQCALLMEKSIVEAPMPSPGRESGVLNAELKRAASANIAPEKKQKILRKNEKKRAETEDAARRQDEIDPMVASLRAAIENAEKRVSLRPQMNELAIAKLEKTLMENFGYAKRSSFEDIDMG